MDWEFLIPFGFVLLLVLFVGGFIVFGPLVRRLGVALEQRLKEPGERGGPDPAELEELRDTVRALEAQVRSLAERQGFTERLLQDRVAPVRIGGAAERE